MSDVLDGALSRFAECGAEFGGGLSNHGPMAAEALVAMGRADAVERWSEWYARKLDAPAAARDPIAPREWRAALGAYGRVGDWSALFQRELDDKPWPAVLDRWVARLAPGIFAGATHGLIRTAHAVRALDRGETAERRRELAEGLAYWAARYQTLPSVDGAPGRLLPHEALTSVPLVPHSAGMDRLISQRVRAVKDIDFAPVLNAVALDVDVGAFVSDITRTFAAQYLRHARTASIAFIHTVTAPAGLRSLAPHVAPETLRAAMRYAWQACAAVYAAYGDGPVVREPTAPGEDAGHDAADLVDQAVAARDEHAIKFTEACLREYACTPDAVYIEAARDAVARLRVR